MHEITFAKNLLRKVNKVVKNKEKVLKIIIEIGELSPLEGEELKELLEKLAPYKFEISVLESCIKCNCGFVGRAKIVERLHEKVIFSCPNCENISCEIIKGDEIKIKKIIYR
ncbi:MAG: hydrogenase/urease maturation nickel metallochaperone HypA [Candidatus Pacearchaeota archaeon]